MKEWIIGMYLHFNREWRIECFYVRALSNEKYDTTAVASEEYETDFITPFHISTVDYRTTTHKRLILIDWSIDSFILSFRETIFFLHFDNTLRYVTLRA